jgi:tRNA-2-methylthio-N6-dimethylallyladenosine synthase
MNYSDAERISTLLEKYKLKAAASIDAADFVVFVTCGVRQSAEDRVYGQINNLRKKYPGKKIVMTGCLAHRKDVQRRLKEKVDFYFPINNFRKFENWLIGNWKLEIPARKNCYQQINSYLLTSPKYTNKYTAYVPVMTGCNNFCSYCVVPYARGREYSRPAEDILKEVRNLVNKGYKEIILLGQNVNSYKSKTLNTPYSILNTKKKTITFACLLQLIESIPGNFWLTFLTSHPKDMSDDLIETVARSKKICEYISLPAQSGNNEVLQCMNRKYTIEHYISLVEKIRAAYDSRLDLGHARDPISNTLPPAISTDIIVGFPGETKKQFADTTKLLREMKYDMAYIAQYSPRAETAALKLKDNVSKSEKERREKFLTEILSKTALANNKKYIGKVIEVLIDKALPTNRQLTKVEPSSKKYLAHTRTQKKVMLSSDKKIPVGIFAKVRITKAKAFGLEGEIKKELRVF